MAFSEGRFGAPARVVKSRVLLAALLLMVLFLSASALPDRVWAAGGATSGQPVAEYRGPSGVRIASYSTVWATQAQLKEIYDELLRNLHGEELSLLDAVELHPEPGEASQGYWDGSWITWPSTGPVMQPGRRIVLYDMDKRSSVREIAPALSHEYGHHFTYYYLGKREGVLFDDAWAQTEWAKRRGLLDYPEADSGPHRWNPAEVAADDYVLLFGSPMAHEVAYAGVSTYYPSDGTTVWYPAARLQENWALPLPTERTGLRQYWLDAMGSSAAALGLPAVPPSPALRIRSLDSSGRATLEWAPATGAPSGSQYTLWWDDVPAPSARPPGASYDGSGIPKQLTSRTSGFGSVYDFTDAFKDSATGWARTYVVTMGDGMIERSNLIWFKRGAEDLWQVYQADPYRSTPAAALWDLTPGHWAERDVLSLYARGAIGGFPDGSFRPNDPLTRAQFTKVLVAALGRAPEPGTGGYAQLARLSTHWLASAGWLVPAIKAGFILPDEWGPGVDIDAPMPRQEMARMAVRALGLKPGAAGGAAVFTDAAQISAVFAGYVAVACQQGILLGFPADDGKVAFHPLEGTTRAQGAVVVNRILAKIAATRR